MKFLHCMAGRSKFRLMTRTAVIQRIESLTDDEFERVAPYLQADLDAVDAVDAANRKIEDTYSLQRAVTLGRQSARTEPLLDDDSVFVMARDRSARPGHRCRNQRAHVRVQVDSCLASQRSQKA